MTIREIQIFGERCSGTNYLAKLLRQNVSDITVTDNYGWKHGDLGQPMKWYKTPESKQLTTKKIHDVNENADHTLIIVIYRNPITWLQSMHRSPHHAPKHWFNEFSEFLRKPWEAYYSWAGQPSRRDEKIRFGCVKPELLFEEYESVIGLRSQKLRLHQSFKERVPNVCYVSLEELQAHPKKTLTTIADKYHLKFSSGFKNIDEDKFGNREYKAKKTQPMSIGDLVHIVQSLDKEAEVAAGYSIKTGRLFVHRFINKLRVLMRMGELQVQNPEKLVAYEPVDLFMVDGKEF